MRNIVRFVCMLLLAGIAAVSCGKKTQPLSVNGEWSLVRVESRAATVGDQTVVVYLSFESGGNFELFQKLGEGRFRKFTGSWTLSGDQLSGRYTTGESWASSYTVSSTDGELVLMSNSGGECDYYVKTTIPPDVREYATF